MKNDAKLYESINIYNQFIDDLPGLFKMLIARSYY